jgi:hypothetical protein
MYEGYDYGSVVLPSYPADQTAIDQWLGVAAAPAATTAPSSISIRVLDGAGDPTAAAEAADKLGALGYRIAGSGYWPPVGPLSETVVEYSPGHLAQAERVSQSLSGIVSITQAPRVAPPGSDVPSSSGVDVTVITGTNFSVAKPPASGGHAGTHHSGGGSTSISTGASSVDSQLSPVSSADPPTPSYDPRACPTK